MTDIQQQILIEQRISNDAKSPVVAYLLAIFLGGFGAHRFYLGKGFSGGIMAVLWLLGFLFTFVFGLGLLLLFPLGIWVLIDLFLIPGMIERDRNRMRDRLSAAIPRS